MSLPALTWVLDNSPATGGARLVLFVLAEHAHDDGSESYPAVDTIARRARMSRRGVQEALRRLEGDGHIERDGTSRKGTTVYRVCMGAQDVRPAQDERGRSSQREGGAAGAPEPSIGTVRPTSSNARDARASVPDGFPDELRPHARLVMTALREAAVERGAAEVTARAVGRAVMDNPRKPLVVTATELRAWLLDGAGQNVPCKDVVARYRRWLAKEPNLAAAERLAADGTPATGPDSPNGVTRLRPRQSERERREAGEQWATFRNLGRMNGMSDAEASAYASEQVAQ